jgi:hypothetical protein
MLSLIRGKINQSVTKFTRYLHSAEKLKLGDFDEKITTRYYIWENETHYDSTRRTYFTKTNQPKEIGYIQYNKCSGEIELFFIYHQKSYQYTNKGLGKQILKVAIDDIKDYNSSDIVWAVTTKDHPFWSNVWNKSFTYADPVHKKLMCDGYLMEI